MQNGQSHFFGEQPFGKTTYGGLAYDKRLELHNIM